MIDLANKINLLPVPDEIPQRGNRLTRFFGCLYMALIGWRLSGQVPKQSKLVAIVAPHTSNIDFLVGMGPLFALGLRLSFMAKSPLFWEPFGTYLRWIGAVPIDRAASGGSVQEAVNEFEKRDKFILVITPEGTRKKVKRWKTGFYHIAYQAGVPILPLTFDYSKKAIHFGKVFMPTGDMENDMAYLKSLYHAHQARFPQSH